MYGQASYNFVVAAAAFTALILSVLAFRQSNVTSARASEESQRQAPLSMSTILPWLFIVVIVVVSIGVIWWRHSSSRQEHTKQQGEQHDVYDAVASDAHSIKAIVQMMIGALAVCIVGWQFLHAGLGGIGVGLAAAAVVELAYTLFTPGPDEALDPLLLALSAKMLMQLAKFPGSAERDGREFLGQAGGLLILGALLAILFGARLFLAERQKGDEIPRIWWVYRKKSDHTLAQTTTNETPLWQQRERDDSEDPTDVGGFRSQ